jgi:hypothetical protein
MKRLAALALLVVAATAPGAGAASLPKPISPVDRGGSAHSTHYVRRDALPKLPSPIPPGSQVRHRSTGATHYVRGK